MKMRLAILLLILLLAPVLYLSARGFYYGFDVQSGLLTAARSLLRQYDHLHSGEQMVDPAAVEQVRKEVQWLGDIEARELEEASGLAQSTRFNQVFYAVNDSRNAPRIYAMSKAGRDRGSWPLDHHGQHDFEDLASFRLDDKSYVLLADTGDNFGWRPSLTMLVIEEPDVEHLAHDSIIPTAWSFQFNYPDGYRDCEAVAVDEDKQVIYLISKRRVPAEVFKLPLKPTLKPAGSQLTAVRVATLTGIPQPNDQDLGEAPYYGRFRSQPTALDITGRRAVVLTYKDAYLYERRAGNTWAETFQGIPRRILLPSVHLLEAGALDKKARFLLITGERPDGADRIGIFQAKL